MFALIPPGFFPFSPHVIPPKEESEEEASSLTEIVEEVRHFIQVMIEHIEGRAPLIFPEIVRQNHLLNELRNHPKILNEEDCTPANISEYLTYLKEEMSEWLTTEHHQQIDQWHNRLETILIEKDNPFPKWLGYFYYK